MESKCEGFFSHLYKSFVVLKGPFFSFKMRKYLLTATQLAEPSDIDFLCSLAFPFLKELTEAPHRKESCSY